MAPTAFPKALKTAAPDGKTPATKTNMKAASNAQHTAPFLVKKLKAVTRVSATRSAGGSKLSDKIADLMRKKKEAAATGPKLSDKIADLMRKKMAAPMSEEFKVSRKWGFARLDDIVVRTGKTDIGDEQVLFKTGARKGETAVIKPCLFRKCFRFHGLTIRA